MAAYILRRILYIIPTLLLASLITYALGFFGPSDPLRDIMGQSYFDEELRERTRHAMGLDRPFIEQYADWLTGFLQGNNTFLQNAGKKATGPFQVLLPVADNIIVGQ